MAIINDIDLPLSLVELMEGSKNKPSGDITASQLVDSPLIYYFKRKYPNLLVSASSSMWLALQSLLEAALETVSSQEGRFTNVKTSATVDGVTISDKIHVIEGSTLYHYLIVGAGSVFMNKKTNGIKPEWEERLNISRWLLSQDPENTMGTPEQIKIVFLLRDHKYGHLEKDGLTSILTRDVPVWSDDKTAKFVAERIAAHKPYLGDGDSMPGQCNARERQCRGTSFAAMKRGQPSAVRSFPTLLPAQAMVNSKMADFVEHRPGRAMRCERYCTFGVEGICPHRDVSEK